MKHLNKKGYLKYPLSTHTSSTLTISTLWSLTLRSLTLVGLRLTNGLIVPLPTQLNYTKWNFVDPMSKTVVHLECDNFVSVDLMIVSPT